MEKSNFIIETEIGQLAVIHYQARKEVNRLKLKRSGMGNVYADGMTFQSDTYSKRKKITDMMWAFSDEGRIAKYKMTCLIKKIIS